MQEASAVEYPFQVDSNDHCETPLVAYQHIKPVLETIAKHLGKTLADLAIYDPYYCEGSMVEKLAQLGLNNVYNRLEDFYQVCAENRVPDFDVLVTNPPYSDEHIPKLLEFVYKCDKPCLLLVPNFVFTKPYLDQDRFFYVCPRRRYRYDTPKGRRQKKSGKYTSPFASFWFIRVGDDAMARVVSGKTVVARSECCLARRAREVPLAVRPDNDARKKRQKNALKRKKNKKRKKVASLQSDGAPHTRRKGDRRY